MRNIIVPESIFNRLVTAGAKHDQGVHVFATEVLRVYLDVAYPLPRPGCDPRGAADENNPPGRRIP